MAAQDRTRNGQREKCHGCKTADELTTPSSADKFARSAVGLRVIAMTALLLSDLDVFFSILFVIELFQIVGESHVFVFFLVIVLSGQTAYFLSIWFIARKQKTRVIKLVLDKMAEHPGQFETSAFVTTAAGPVPKHTLTPDIVVLQHHVVVTCAHSVNPPGVVGTRQTFASLRPTGDTDEETKKRNMIILRDGLTMWGLYRIWTSVSRANTWNTTELKHSMPIWRTARLGYYSTIDAKDLCGILNANALYSFLTGLVQILFGVIVILWNTSRNRPVRVGSIIALSISSLSLLLTVLNIMYDFGGKMVEAEDEKAVQATVMERCTESMESQKKEARRGNRNTMSGINNLYDGMLRDLPLDSTYGQREGIMVSKIARLKEASTQLSKEMNLIGIAVQDILEAELKSARQTRARVAAIMGGKVFPPCTCSRDACESIEDTKVTKDRLLARIWTKRCEELADPRLTALDCDKFDVEIKKINEKCLRNQQVVEANIRIMEGNGIMEV